MKYEILHPIGALCAKAPLNKKNQQDEPKRAAYEQEKRVRVASLRPAPPTLSIRPASLSNLPPRLPLHQGSLVLENTVPYMDTNIVVAREISTPAYFANMLPPYWYDYIFYYYVVGNLRNMVLRYTDMLPLYWYHVF